MSGQWHPGTEAIADFQAGLVGGSRGRRLAAHIADCARCASVRDQLGAVSSVLASVPASSLPDAFERRIAAALAAEAIAREGAAREGAASPVAAVAAAAGQDSPDQVAPEHRSRPPRRRGYRFRPAMALVPVAACLLAGLGYLLTTVGGTPTESSAENAAGSAVTSSASAPALSPARNAISQPLERASFLVTASGVNYQQATLSTQVRAELVAQQHHALAVPEPSATPTASGGEFGTPSGALATGSSPGSVPSLALVGCVLHLTGGTRPSLVDRATYQGKPAYVIAEPGKAWVVGLGCTASKPDLITSVSLATAP